MRLLHKKEAGVAMIMALIMLALGGLLVTPALKLALTSLKYHGTIERRTMESYAADSGVEYALCKLRNDPSTDNFTDNFTLNGRTVTVTATDIGSNTHQIVSTATSSGGRSTTVQSQFLTLSIFSQHVVMSNGDIDIVNADIDSYPVSGEANIHSNGDFSITNATLDGDVTYVGTVDIQNSTVTGTVEQVADAEVLPPIDTEFWENEAKVGGTYTGDLEIKNNPGYSLGPLYIDGDLSIKNSTVTLEGAVYVTGEVEVVTDSIVTGAQTLLAEGDVEIKTADYDPDNLPLIMSVNGDITCQAGSLIGALLYAPNDKIYLQGGTFFGSAVGKGVDITNITFTYITEIPNPEDLPGSEVLVITYGYGP